jgi:hypothetical protein
MEVLCMFCACYMYHQFAADPEAAVIPRSSADGGVNNFMQLGWAL